MHFVTRGIAFGLVYCNAVTPRTVWYVYFTTFWPHATMFVNGVYLGKSLKTHFLSPGKPSNLVKYWKVLENSVLMSVRTLYISKSRYVGLLVICVLHIVFTYLLCMCACHCTELWPSSSSTFCFYKGFWHFVLFFLFCEISCFW